MYQSMLSQDVIAFSYIKCNKILCSSLYTGALGCVIYVNVSQLEARIKLLVRILARQVQLSLLLCPYLLFEGKGFYCSQDKGYESPTGSQITEREIQISSEAISVTNTAFVGEGVIMIFQLKKFVTRRARSGQ